MKKTICLCLFLLLPLSGGAGEIETFHWEYDLVYHKGKSKYKGTGEYLLRSATDKKSKESGEDRYEFIVSILSNNEVFSSKERLLLKHNAEHFVVPLNRRLRARALFIPINRKTKISPPESGAYYDEMSAIIYLRRQVKDFALGKSQVKEWKMWLADRNKWESYYLSENEKIQTPLGEFNCYVINKREDNPNSTLKVWIAEDSFYIVRSDRKHNDEETFILIKRVIS